MVLEVPVNVEFDVSVAVMVWLPAVTRVAVKVAVPLVSVALAGRVALPSELVKWTLSPKPVTVLLAWFRAVTVKVNAPPALAVAGADTAKWIAAVEVVVPWEEQ